MKKDIYQVKDEALSAINQAIADLYHAGLPVFRIQIMTPTQGVPFANVIFDHGQGYHGIPKEDGGEK